MQITLAACLGAAPSLSPLVLPEGMVQSAENVELSALKFLQPRVGTTTVSLTSGPNTTIYHLFTERIDGVERLWAWSLTGGGTLQPYFLSSGAWTGVALTDTPATNTSPAIQGHTCAYNGKVFLAYNSSVNRLHVYSESVVRRVGIGLVAAATVANTGAGAYAATLRYYKIQMRIYKAADIAQARLATSELSAVVSFTPSGAGTAARITKPTTIDSSTHWVVYASSDNVNFYDISGPIAVATTTYDDVALIAAYPGNPLPPEAGLFVPPPSAKYLATNGERLFMAGSYETTAGSGETTPANRRVWFTRPLGVTDHGDDEAITQTGDFRYYLDIDNEDGSSLTGLLSTLDGSVYAFTDTSLWRLSDTGQADTPIRAERVVNGVGPMTPYTATAVPPDAEGASIYFEAKTGPYRYGPSIGLQYLGSDWCNLNGSAPTLPSAVTAVQYDVVTRRVAFAMGLGTTALTRGYVWHFFAPFSEMRDGAMRGGWSRDNIGALAYTIHALGVKDNQLHIGGQLVGSSAAALGYRDEAAHQDLAAVPITATIRTKEIIPIDATRNFRTREPYVFRRKAQALSFTYRRNGGESTATDTLAADSSGGTVTERIKVEGLVASDAYTLDVEVSCTIVARVGSYGANEGVDRMIIPVDVAEMG